MLFDLQGKRRRLIQVTYLTLAILLGGGLVLFGIGSDVQGGLADIFSGSSDSEDASPALEDQLQQAEETLAANPRDPEALAEVARANYQLATTTDPEARAAGVIFAEDATPRLEAAAEAWSDYLQTDPKQPDDALAFLMIQVYGQQGLNEPDEAARAAEIVAEERRDSQAYLIYAQYAALAGDERGADLAGKQAVSLAPSSQRDQVQRQVDSLIRAAEGLRSGEAPGGAGAVPPGGEPIPGGGGLPPADGTGGGGGP